MMLSQRTKQVMMQTFKNSTSDNHICQENKEAATCTHRKSISSHGTHNLRVNKVKELKSGNKIQLCKTKEHSSKRKFFFPFFSFFFLTCALGELCNPRLFTGKRLPRRAEITKEKECSLRYELEQKQTSKLRSPTISGIGRFKDYILVMFIILYSNRLNSMMLSITEWTRSDRPEEQEGAKSHSPVQCTFPHGCSSTPGSTKLCFQNPSAWNLHFLLRNMNQLLVKRDFINQMQPDPSEHTGEDISTFASDTWKSCG